MFETLHAGIQFFSDQAPGGFCLSCFLTGVAEGVVGGVIGLAVLAVVAAAAPELAVALTVVAVVAGAIGLVKLISNWDRMSGDQKSEAVGGVVGGLLLGKLAPRGPLTMPGPALAAEGGMVVSDAVVVAQVGAAEAVGAGAAGSAGVLMTTGGGGSNDSSSGDSEPPPSSKPATPRFGQAAQQHGQARNHTADGQPPVRNPQKSAQAGHDVYDSKFADGEGGQAFTDEVINHPGTVRTVQSDGRIRYDNPNLGRPTGTGPDGQPVSGGRVVVESSSPGSYSQTPPGEVVTQFPQ